MKIKTYTSRFPEEAAAKATSELKDCKIIDVKTCFDNNNHFCLTVVYCDELKIKFKRND